MTNMKEYILLNWPESQEYIGEKDCFICNEIDGACFVPCDKYYKEHLNTSMVLKYLNKLGWSDLIDEKWAKEIEWTIKSKFPDISNELLQKILNIIII